MHILGMIIAGAILGALARFILKGDQNIGMIWTIILGALGWGIGGWIVSAINSSSTALQWIIGLIVAIILIAAFVAIRNKKEKK